MVQEERTCFVWRLSQCPEEEDGCFVHRMAFSILNMEFRDVNIGEYLTEWGTGACSDFSDTPSQTATP